jgi:hypothetical protein
MTNYKTCGVNYTVAPSKNNANCPCGGDKDFGCDNDCESYSCEKCGGWFHVTNGGAESFKGHSPDCGVGETEQEEKTRSENWHDQWQTRHCQMVNQICSLDEEFWSIPNQMKQNEK